MIRARIAFRAEPADRLIVVRYIGALDGETLVRQLMTHFRATEAAWEYDCIFDLTRHEGVVQAAHNEELGRQWLDVTQGRDTGRMSAIISTDPLVHSRLRGSQTMFPHRTLAVFNTVDEGRAWIAIERVRLLKSA